MKTSVKKVFESDNWVITKILQGSNGRVRIDAKTRFFREGEENFFSEWCTKKYADSLSVERYGKTVNELNVWIY